LTREDYLEYSRKELRKALSESLDSCSGLAVGRLHQDIATLVIRRNSISNGSVGERAKNLATRYTLEKRMFMEFHDPARADQFLETLAISIRNLDFIALARGVSLKDSSKSSIASCPTLDMRSVDVPRGKREFEQSFIPLLTNKRILIVSSIANQLATRANAETFESVWGKLGFEWFNPSKVIPFEFPHIGSTRQELLNLDALDLLQYVFDSLPNYEFDIALVGAGPFGNPLVSQCKNMGKIGISMGGDLQLLFGVYGSRWLKIPNFRETFMNEYWVRRSREQGLDEEKTRHLDESSYW
jgi:hypothetical protein